MPHHIYHTHAIVMRGKNKGEADRVLELLTERFGLLTVSVRGLRKESSKLRFILQPHTWVEVSMVRGAEGWRLTTANPLWGKGGGPTVTLAKIFLLLRQFYPDQTPGDSVFGDLSLFCQALDERPEHKDVWEALFIARFFAQLGYWGDGETRRHVEESVYREPVSQEHRVRIISEINRILRTVQT